MRIIIEGSNGRLHVDADTGEVLARHDYNSATDPENYGDIARVNVAELRATYPEGFTDCDCASFDILDCGYWTKAGAYEPPAADWRATATGDTNHDHDDQAHARALLLQRAELRRPHQRKREAAPLLAAWGKTGYRAVSVYDWNGDRVPDLGAGGCGYDKRGTAVGNVLMRLCGKGLLWLARKAGTNREAGGFYGLSWSIYEHTPSPSGRGAGKWSYSHQHTDAARKRSHRAPSAAWFASRPRLQLRVRLDGGCGYECMTAVALAMGLQLDRIDTGKDSEAYVVRPVRVIRERYTFEDGRISRPYLRAAVAA